MARADHQVQGEGPEHTCFHWVNENHPCTCVLGVDHEMFGNTDYR